MEELNKGYKFTKAQIAELESLRAWKAEIEKQEPVAHMNAKRDMTFIHGPYNPDDIPLFAAPAVSPDVDPVSLPKLPPYIAKGNLGVCYYDGFQMHQYAVKYADQSTAKLLAENQSLKTELEAARSSRAKDALDAERYRWMRSFRPGLWLDGITLEPIENEGYALQLDSAIDAAIEQASSCNELHEKGGA